MKKNNIPFQINFLDHVAIRVKDMDATAQWYERVLGLKKVHPPEWTPAPYFLFAGTTGIAVFPANTDHPTLDQTSRNVKIDHFAFNVSNEDFQKARERYEDLGLSYTFSDHTYFHSIYTRDPDGHTVELTTLVVSDDFYENPPG